MITLTYPLFFWVTTLVIMLLALSRFFQESRMLRVWRQYMEAGFELRFRGHKPRHRIPRLWLRLLALWLGVLALAQPMGALQEATQWVKGRDWMLVLDGSRSMDAEDVQPSRLEQAKEWLRAWMQQHKGDRMGLVAFAGNAEVLVPITEDAHFVTEHMLRLSPSDMDAQGTDVGLALEVALRSLQAGSLGGTDETGNRAFEGIVLVSDGEDHEAHAIEVASMIQTAGLSLIVLGIGTEEGAPIPIRDANGDITDSLRDANGQIVLTKFNPSFLQNLAKEGGGNFVHLSRAATLPKSEGSGGESERRLVHREPLYPYVLGLMLFVLALESFLLWAPLLCIGLEAKAEPIAETRAYFSNKMAIKKSQEEKPDEGMQALHDAQVDLPDSPVLEWNQGLLSIQKGQGESGRSHFRRSAELAKKVDPKKAKEMELKALYNEAKSFELEGSYKQAREGYVKTIREAKAVGAKELVKMAQKNLALLNKKEDQPQPKPSGEPDPQASGSPEKAQKGEQGEKEPQPRDFKSDKLKEEDAEQVFQTLEAQERKASEKQKERQGSRKAKDW
jgi:Ca-activated chloride channel homolog